MYCEVTCYILCCIKSSQVLLLIIFVSDGWSRTSHPCTRNEFGVWELTIPYKEDGSSPIPHGSKVKVSVENIVFVYICDLPYEKC